jgi:hypothetical protein
MRASFTDGLFDALPLNPTALAAWGLLPSLLSEDAFLAQSKTKLMIIQYCPHGRPNTWQLMKSQLMQAKII